MNINYGNNTILSNQINLYQDKFIINNRKHKINKNCLIELNSNELDVFHLYTEFNRIRKAAKFEDFLIVLSEDIEGMFIEFTMNEFKVNSRDVIVYIGHDFLSNSDETDILVFFSHELGHLLDGESIYGNQRKEVFIKKALFAFYFIANSYLIYLLTKKDLNSYYILSLILSGLMGGLSKKIGYYLNKFFSRQEEYNADVFAVKLIKNPAKVIASYEYLQSVIQEPESFSIDSTHPSLPQRIRFLKKRFFFYLFINKIFNK